MIPHIPEIIQNLPQATASQAAMSMESVLAFRSLSLTVLYTPSITILGGRGEDYMQIADTRSDGRELAINSLLWAEPFRKLPDNDASRVGCVEGGLPRDHRPLKNTLEYRPCKCHTISKGPHFLPKSSHRTDYVWGDKTDPNIHQ